MIANNKTLLCSCVVKYAMNSANPDAATNCWYWNTSSYLKAVLASGVIPGPLQIKLQ